jgi:pimeloyl-ACP methyl ester carboxylesterase
MPGPENLCWEDRYWWSGDGVRLHARDYAGGRGAGGNERPPILCFPGLTRNARDFEGLAAVLAGAWRVIVVEFRGRGDSGYAKDPMTYVPLTYVADVEALLSELGIGRFVAVGTSLGGIVTMLLAGTTRARLAAALINDVGPHIEPAGLQRIRGYVGRPSNFPTWMHAARAVAETNAEVYPGWAMADWLAMAKRLYRLTSAGRIVLDYDLKIAEPFRVPGGEGGPDLWQALARLRGVPTLVVRGARSDLLSAATAERMVAALPGAELVTVPGVGHAPTLAEPVLQDPIARLLQRALEPVAA